MEVDDRLLEVVDCLGFRVPDDKEVDRYVDRYRSMMGYEAK